VDTGTVTLVTTLAGFALLIWRDERKRKWDKEDRLAIAATLALHTTETAATVAQALATRTNKTSDKLVELIAENTKISTDAFHEANTVNQKLEKLGLEHNAIDRRAASTKERHDDKK